jgi:hypothetical protein
MLKLHGRSTSNGPDYLCRGCRVPVARLVLIIRLILGFRALWMWVLYSQVQRVAIRPLIIVLIIISIISIIISRHENFPRKLLLFTARASLHTTTFRLLLSLR